VTLLLLSKLARKTEQELLGKGYVAPGIPKPARTELPTVKKPQTWEFSAHPHLAERAGLHTDMRLGNPETGIAHSFVLPKRAELPGPGEMVRVVPTFDHDIDYMDYTGKITSEYGKGVVVKGRREKADVYHGASGQDKGTKLRFNLYGGSQPEEFSLRSDGKGGWFLHNKTLTRERRPDLPADKPELKEIDIDTVDAANDKQVMMPKLDGAHTVIDLQAGRAPRVFSYRVGKISKTGLIEHTHKLPDLLTRKVPTELDGTVLRAETVGVDQSGKVLPAAQIAGLLNSKVWESRRQQEKAGVKLKAFPFNVVKFQGRDVQDAPFEDKLRMIEQVRRALPALGEMPVVTDPKDKVYLLNAIKSKDYPLTTEGVVLVDKDQQKTIKAKVLPDYDVYVRKVLPAVSGKTGEELDRAGAVAYSWTPAGPVVGQVAGFRHDEARDMLQNPDRYIGRVAKVKALRKFTDSGKLFQPRFKEWHLDKGDIEKNAMQRGFFDELNKIADIGPSPIDVAKVVDPRTYWAHFGKSNREKKEFLKRQEKAEAGALAGALLGIPVAGVGYLASRLIPAQSIPGVVDYERVAKEVGVQDIPKLVEIADARKSYFHPGRNLIVSNRAAPEIMGHELGHKWVQEKVPNFLRVVSHPLITRAVLPFLGTAAGLSLAASDPESIQSQAAPLAAVAGWTPTLADEAAASIKSLKALKQMGFTSKDLWKFRKNLGLAFGTYGAATLASALLPLMAQRAVRAREQKKRR